LNTFKEGVKNPAEKESGLMLKYGWIIGLFSKKIHEISTCINIRKEIIFSDSWCKIQVILPSLKKFNPNN